MLQKKPIRTTLIFTSIALATPSIARHHKQRKQGENPNDNSPIKVTIARAKAGVFFDSKKFAGLVKSVTPKKYYPQKEGRITDVHVKNNHFVKKGDALLSIMPTNKGFAYRKQVLRSRFSGYLQDFEPHIGAPIKTNQIIGKIIQTGLYELEVLAPIHDYLTLKNKKKLTVLFNYQSPRELKVIGMPVKGFPNSDTDTGFFKLKVTLNCFDQKEKKKCHKYVIPGTIGHLILKLDSRKNIVIKPEWINKKDSTVFILEQNQSIAQRKVVLGKSDKGKLEVVQGLHIGDKIIISASRKLRKGLQAIVEKEIE